MTTQNSGLNMNSEHNDPQRFSQEPRNPSAPDSYSDPDEINLLEYMYVLVKHKFLIIAFALLGLIGGHIVAVIKGPSWTGTAVVAPRETDRQQPSVSGFGAFGGLVSSQLGLGGNASLEKLDVLLSSRHFNTELIREHNLELLVMRVLRPKQYEAKWDAEKNTWKDPLDTVDARVLAGDLVNNALSRSIEKNNTMKIQVSERDSAFVTTLLPIYVEYLDWFVRNQVTTESKENVDYLNTKLIVVSDPLLREKIQELIASELEKAMVVSKEAFRVIDPPFVQKSHKEKRLYPLVFGFGLSFLVVLVVVLGHALLSSEKTPGDKELIAAIKREMMFGLRKG